MRREDYERSYGRRGFHPPVSPSQESRRRSRDSSRRSRKMKCLISVGLILPALAAIIGVAAWAISADVVMNANGNRVNKADNQLLKGISEDRRDDGRRDIFQDNHINRDHEQRVRNVIPERQSSERTVRKTTAAPSPSSDDVSKILSKLISASNAASGNSGPRFVVVAPLPDHAKVISPDDKDNVDTIGISRADHRPTAKFEESSWKPTRNEDNGHDLVASASHQRYQSSVQAPPSFHQPPNNITNRVGLANNNKPTNHRRTEQQPSFVIDFSTNNNNKRRNFNSPIDMSGFEPFMSPETLLGSSSVVAGPSPPQVPGFVATGPFKTRNPQNGFLNSPRDPPMFEQKHTIFNDPPSFIHNSNRPHPPPPHGTFGLKPIQQHHSLHHHHDSPMVAEESNRWGAVSFHPPLPPSLHIPKPPEGISLSISSPEKSHISAEPVSVIKSFFLPFLPKPKINMNARVVFGVVLDKGVGLGGQKKDAGHLRPY